MTNKKIKKSYHNKKRKPFYKKRSLWIVLVGLGSLILFFLVLAFEDFYQLETIEVEGVEETTAASLKSVTEARAGFGGSESLVFIDTREIQKEILQSYPQLAKVDLTKNFPDSLKLEVDRRDEELTWCVEDCYYIDRKGVAFKRVENENNLIVKSQVHENPGFGESVASEKVINFIFNSLHSLEDDFSPKDIKIPSERALFVNLEEGPEIRFDILDDLGDQLERLVLLIDTEIDDFDEVEYIELRYGNRVYFKPLE